MSGERATYLDSSAIVKLAVAERESAALRRYLRRRHLFVVSALARTEVGRALLPLGEKAVHAGRVALAGIDLVRVNDRLLSAAGSLRPVGLRSLDAIHLATALELRDALTGFVTYDERLAAAARDAGLAVAAPR